MATLENGFMRAGHVILLATLLSSCATSPPTTRHRLQPKFDAGIGAVNVGGFRLQMTPRAALAVIQAKGYRESSEDRVTLEDLALDSLVSEESIVVFQFSYGESLDDRLTRETGIFRLDFSQGRVEAIHYDLNNLSKEKLKTIREQNEEAYSFVTERQTNQLTGPRNGTAISWNYKPNDLASLSIHYVEREPMFANPRLGDPGVGGCQYSIMVFDGNPNIARLLR